jgi:hypothetical protein
MDDTMPDGMFHTSRLDLLPKDKRDALMAEVDALNDPEYIKYVLGEDALTDNTKKYYSSGFPAI